jgi:hypothetical protein
MVVVGTLLVPLVVTCFELGQIGPEENVFHGEIVYLVVNSISVYSEPQKVSLCLQFRTYKLMPMLFFRGNCIPVPSE